MTIKRLEKDSYHELLREADYNGDTLVFSLKKISRSLKNQGKKPEQITEVMEALRIHYMDRIATEVF